MTVRVYSIDGEHVAEKCLSCCAGIVIAIRGQRRFDVVVVAWWSRRDKEIDDRSVLFGPAAYIIIRSDFHFA